MTSKSRTNLTEYVVLTIVLPSPNTSHRRLSTALQLVKIKRRPLDIQSNEMAYIMTKDDKAIQAISSLPRVGLSS